MRVTVCAAVFGAVAAVGVVIAVPAGAASFSPWRPPPVTTATVTQYCAQNDHDPLTLTTTTTQIPIPRSRSTLVGGRATVSGGPNGKTFSFVEFYRETPPGPTQASDSPVSYLGWAVVGTSAVLGDGGPLYLEGGTAVVDHYGQAEVISGRSIDLCAASGYPAAS
jgi:hypothetical protein